MQKRSREGFTLIELLAVIVILAVIALIAIPEVIDIIAKARKHAFEDSVYGIIRAGEMYYTNELLENGGMSEDKEFIIENGKFKGDKLPINGSLPNSGKVKVTADGDVALALSDGKYYVQKTTTESEIEVKSLKEDKIKEEELDYKEEPSKLNPVFTTSTLNSSIPACITNNTECEAGTGVAIKVNDTETYDFYVMSDNTSENEITLFMSENLGEDVEWVSKEDYIKAGGEDLSNDENCQNYGECSKNDKGPVTALKALEERTSSWTNIPEGTYTLKDDNDTPLYSPMTRTARARLITFSEADTLYLSDNNSWLYGNLNSSASYGYWTSSAFSAFNTSACYMSYNVNIHLSTIDVFDKYGIRPVITISKTIM